MLGINDKQGIATRNAEMVLFSDHIQVRMCCLLCRCNSCRSKLAVFLVVISVGDVIPVHLYQGVKKVKVNFTLEQAMTTQRGSRCIAVLFLQPWR